MVADGSLALITERIAHHLTGAEARPLDPEPAVANRLRDLLDAEAFEGVKLAEVATRLGRSKPHLVRSFTAAYGIAPHAYVIARRIERARKLLLEGMAPADAAAVVGFYDQSHLTRHFKRHTSVPPATFAAFDRR